MANQPQQLTLPPPRSYTRTDFTVLRAFSTSKSATWNCALFSQRRRNDEYAQAHCPSKRWIGKTFGQRGSSRAAAQEAALILALASAPAMDEA
ncbi:hypothetical protein [Caballeronia grimmiae]|uniref:DRBM domain-containing protein n=1 Tax=Caballeronia grimmiae TaxID=1071679 RepID=A0ABQ1RKN6_9BURK|nr:hypothetical protein [Caballeronia grimmiae]GGD70147.1 hypothetical protein GCM10010985_25810 [Caballeronia grimmiae]